MKKNKIFNGLKELYRGKSIYSKLMIVITICVFLSITFLSINNGNEIKSYVQSVIDGDPNYKKLKEKVSIFAYRKTINLNEFAEGINENDSEVVKGPITASNIKGGFDEFNPQQIVQEDSDSNNTNNSISSNGNSSINDNNTNNSNNSNNISNNDYVDNNVNKNDENQQILIDKSSFIGKDIIILEGSSFNAMKNLQLSATDVDGKNITDKIVITENNVDIYKPGLYTVKANVQLSNNSKLEKDFLVRVEPTILQLAVKDIQLSKEMVEKNETFVMSFDIDSSKDYLDVAAVTINNVEYEVNKVANKKLFRRYDKYEVELNASNRAGIEEIKFENITMSDGTKVDVNESISIEVLRDEPKVTDLEINSILEDNKVILKIQFLLEDVDHVLNEVKATLYDSDNEIVEEEVIETNKLLELSYEVSENNIYTFKILTNEYTYRNVELLNRVIKVNEVTNPLELINEYDLLDELEHTENSSKESSSDKSRQYTIPVNSNSTTGANQSSTTGTNQSILTKDKTIDTETKVNGKYINEAGNMPSGTLKVTIPTNIAFTVTNDSRLIASKIRINNYGELDIEVCLESFNDINNEAGIEIVKGNVTNNDKRSKISLNMTGNVRTIYLGDEELFSDSNYSKNITEDEKKLAVIDRRSSSEIILNGSAGTSNESINKPIQDKFIARFKIRKKT